MAAVRLDLNDPDLKAALARLSERGRKETLGTFRKIVPMTWQQVYRDQGLNWEKIKSRPGPAGKSLYSFRISQKIRGVAYRHGDFMRVLAVHEDHDSAYTWPETGLVQIGLNPKAHTEIRIPLLSQSASVMSHIKCRIKSFWAF